ncbi:MAG: carbon storage regulator CsrA [Thermoguttaceae bacterium]|nr:carbon storage regulator CsrA [Thermoguttaceae bacterium]
MLVLSRKKNESVFVNGNIRVVIVDVRGDKVQLGIEAPNDVTVYRSEVLEKIQQSEKSSDVETLDMSRRGAVYRNEKRNVQPRDRKNGSENDRRQRAR